MNIRVFEGDCGDVLAQMPEATYTAVVTDSPYGLSTPPKADDVLRQWLEGGEFTRRRRGQAVQAKGFLGHTWDGFVPGPPLWRKVHRVCKPGAIALVFVDTRTAHWTAIALLLAGFEIIDQIAWVQAQGMAKAGTVDKKIDARLGVERPVIGKHPNPARNRPDNVTLVAPLDRVDVDLTAPGSIEAAEWEGWSTQLADAQEVIIVARKPCEGTAVSNVLRHGCGAMNIAACLIGDESTRRTNKADMGFAGSLSAVAAGESYETGSDAGRWTKNVLLDETAAEILDAIVGERASGSRRAGVRSGMGYGGADGDGGPAIKGSTGGPSRFFWVGPCAQPDDLLLPIRYVPKVTRPSQRNDGLPTGLDCKHPTMKPVELMRYLCRLVGHPRGRILDPFVGSGSTLAAARLEGLPCDGIEREPEYARIARIRGGVARLQDLLGLPPLRLPTDPRSGLDEFLSGYT